MESVALGLLDLANRNIGQAVYFEFQINKELFHSISINMSYNIWDIACTLKYYLLFIENLVNYSGKFVSNSFLRSIW